MIKSPVVVGAGCLGLAMGLDLLFFGGWTAVTAVGLVAGVLVAGGMLAEEMG